MPTHEDLRPILAQSLARLISLGYPNAPPNDAVRMTWVEVMAESLADLSVADVEHAFASYLRSSEQQDRFMPTPGRIRALTPAAVLLAEARGKSPDAWQAVLRAAWDSARGGTRIRDAQMWLGGLPPEPVLVATEAAVQAVGGWIHIGRHEDCDRVLGPSFRRAYEAHLSRQAAPHRRLPDVSATAQITGPTDG